MNNVCIIGNLTRDPEFRNIGEKQTLKAWFDVAISKKIGEKKSVDYIPVVCWGKTAEYVRNYLKKGNKVSIVGQLETGSYEKDNGEKVKTWGVSILPFGLKSLSPQSNQDQDQVKPTTTTTTVMTDEVPF